MMNWKVYLQEFGRGISEILAGVPTDIRTKNFPNVSVGPYRYASPRAGYSGRIKIFVEYIFAVFHTSLTWIVYCRY
jgi:hypothetical protein